MGKLIGIGALVLGVWFAVEVYTNGSAGAFGGALVEFGLAEPAAPGTPQTSGERVRSAASRAHAEAAERRQRMLAE